VEGKEEFPKAAQCDTYLLHMARGFVSLLYKKKKYVVLPRNFVFSCTHKVIVNQGFVERFPKVSDLEPRSRICIIERRGWAKILN
jgi:hypothetical protein